MIENVVIVDAVRSAVGRAGKGSLAYTRPRRAGGSSDRGAPGARPAGQAVGRRKSRPRLRDAGGRARHERRPHRGLAGGLPVETSAMTINRFCSSGLQAIAIAAGAI